jgi:hypothetical protein
VSKEDLLRLHACLTAIRGSSVPANLIVMAGLVPAIHRRVAGFREFSIAPWNALGSDARASNVGKRSIVEL